MVGQVLAALLHCDAGRCMERVDSDVCAVVGVVDCKAVGKGVEVSKTEGEGG